MAYTIYEYATVTEWGEPVEPAHVRTASVALGAASSALAPNTCYAVVVPDADMYLRISRTGLVATAADYKLLATGGARGFPISLGAIPKLYGLTTS